MENVYFKNDSFVDYRGDEHKFTIAALVTSEPQLYVEDEDDDVVIPTECSVRLGVAICSTKDEWDSTKGEMIAEGRARSYANDMAVITSKAMRPLFDEDGILKLLDNEIEFIKSHPGKYISGYYESEKKYLAEKEKAALIDSLSEDEKRFYDCIVNKNLSENLQKLVNCSVK